MKRLVEITGRRWQQPRCEFAPSPGAILHSFRERYNQFLDSSPFNCSGCIRQEECRGKRSHEDWIEVTNRSPFEPNGVQGLTCYSCLEHFCHYCDEDIRPSFCGACEKMYCGKCVPAGGCSNGSHHYSSSIVRFACEGCKIYAACEGCNDTFCDDCLWTCDCCNAT